MSSRFVVHSYQKVMHDISVCGPMKLCLDAPPRAQASQQLPALSPLYSHTNTCYWRMTFQSCRPVLGFVKIFSHHPSLILQGSRLYFASSHSFCSPVLCSRVTLLHCHLTRLARHCMVSMSFPIRAPFSALLQTLDALHVSPLFGLVRA